MEAELVFKAVADQHRRHLLDALALADGQTLNKLCGGLPMTRIGVMKHLGVLEQAGLITTRKVGRERRHYLNAAPLEEVATWLEPYRRRWNARMDRLEDLVNRTYAQEKANAAKKPRR
jgi:DNA-binding transcriptional ArsR family regulator